MVVLRFPHLVLADVGDDDRLVGSRGAPEIVDHVRSIEMPIVGQRLDVAHGRIAAGLADRGEPLAPIATRD